MKKKDKRRKNGMMLIYILLIAVIFIVAGYAIFSQTITFTGTATSDASFVMLWENPVISDRYDGDLTPAPTLTVNDTVLSVAAVFRQPSDFIEITVNVKNNGNIPAIITDVSLTNIVGPDFQITYTPDFEIAQTIAAGATTPVVIKIEYLPSSETQGLIEETFGVIVEYTQNF